MRKKRGQTSDIHIFHIIHILKIPSVFKGLRCFYLFSTRFSCAIIQLTSDMKYQVIFRMSGVTMSKFSVYRDVDNGCTYVSNKFIDEYLADANAAQIKVFLYLLRMTGQATSISDMADKFNYTEKDICRALKYWETKQLLGINYDMSGSVVGVQLYTSPTSNNIATAIPAQTFVPVSVPFNNNIITASTTMPLPATERKLETVNEYAKPDYSADDLKIFKEQEETAELIFIAEQYLGKTLSPADIKSLLFITDVLSFSTDLIDYLLTYCVDKGKKSFRYIETVAINWAQEGITTPDEARANTGKYDKNVYSVMRALGKDSVPTDAEANYVRRWINEFGFSTDVIMEACNRCVMSTDKNRFAYTDSILKNWQQAGVITTNDIKTADSKYRPAKKSVDTTFHQFDMKHNYDFDAMEKALLSQQ